MKTVRERALYLARLVQGSQALEGAALDAAGFEQLVQHAEKLIREKDATMTDGEQYAANAAENERIRACPHNVTKLDRHGRVTCAGCGCEFAAVLKPRLMRPMPFPELEDADE